MIAMTNKQAADYFASLPPDSPAEILVNTAVKSECDIISVENFELATADAFDTTEEGVWDEADRAKMVGMPIVYGWDC